MSANHPESKTPSTHVESRGSIDKQELPTKSVTAPTASRSPLVWLMDLIVKPFFAGLTFVTVTTILAFVQNYQAQRLSSYITDTAPEVTNVHHVAETAHAIVLVVSTWIWSGTTIHVAFKASGYRSFLKAYATALPIESIAMVGGLIALRLAVVVWAVLEDLIGSGAAA